VRALAEAMGIRDCTLDDLARVSGGRVSRTSPLWFANDVGSRAPRVARTRALGCLRHDLGTCAGPCIGAGDAASYREAADAVRVFLEGHGREPVRRLEAAMADAAAALEFERAGVIRDRLALVQWLYDRLQHFHANVDRLTFRYHAWGEHSDREYVYLIRRGTVRAEVPAPRTPEEAATFRATVQRIYEGIDPTGADIPTHDLDEFYLVASWFRRRPEEKKRTRSALAGLSVASDTAG
jgi:excinuclease ABC subunit C